MQQTLSDRIDAAAQATAASKLFVVDYGDRMYVAARSTTELPQVLASCVLLTAFGERFRFNEAGEKVDESTYDSRSDLRFAWGAQP